MKLDCRPAAGACHRHFRTAAHGEFPRLRDRRGLGADRRGSVELGRQSGGVLAGSHRRAGDRCADALAADGLRP